MRILLLSNLYPPQILGGYEMTCQRVAEELAVRGHEVRVLTSPTYLADPGGGVEVHRLLGLRTYFPLPATGGEIAQLLHHEASVSRFENSRILLQELRDFAPDQVLAFNLLGLGGLGLIDLLTSVGAPWLLNLGDKVPNFLVDGIPSEVLAVYGADHADFFADLDIVAVSTSLVESIEAGGVRLGEVEVIGRGVVVPDEPRGRDYRSDGRTRFTFAGSLASHKGVDLIVEAAASVAAEHLDFTIELFGAGDVEGYRERAVAAGVGELLDFRGPRSREEVLAAHLHSDAFLFPTWAGEPFGVAPVEAAAAGCVPIITDDCGVAEFLIDGVDCVKIERSVASLAAAMTAAITGELDLSGLGERARATARGLLGFGRSVDLIEAALARTASPGWRDARLYDDGVEGDIMMKDQRAINLLHARFSGAETPNDV